MTRNERERLTRQKNTLMELGFTREESDSLRRISLRLQRWYGLECGTDTGSIERDDATGKPYWTAEVGNIRTGFRTIRTPMADFENGALRRLAKIMRDVNGRRTEKPSFVDNLRDDLTTYIQMDPRGAALYILRPGDIPEGASVESCYTRGVCVS
jgi:hypothetical protein